MLQLSWTHHTFWLGDLNYRINGNRKAVDALLACDMYDALKNNDQLSITRKVTDVFGGYDEVNET